MFIKNRLRSAKDTTEKLSPANIIGYERDNKRIESADNEKYFSLENAQVVQNK